MGGPKELSLAGRRFYLHGFPSARWTNPPADAVLIQGVLRSLEEQVAAIRGPDRLNGRREFRKEFLRRPAIGTHHVQLAGPIASAEGRVVGPPHPICDAPAIW